MAGIKITAADKWFSLYVRCRDHWTCQRCGHVYKTYEEGGDNSTLSGLHDAHCFGRRGMSTRYEPDNSMALCYGDHNYVDANPEIKRELFIKKVGQKRYDELRLLSNKPMLNAKKRQKEISDHFRGIFREMLSQQA